jgi:hypothetical protein
VSSKSNSEFMLPVKTVLASGKKVVITAARQSSSERLGRPITA